MSTTKRKPHAISEAEEQRAASRAAWVEAHEVTIAPEAIILEGAEAEAAAAAMFADLGDLEEVDAMIATERRRGRPSVGRTHAAGAGPSRRRQVRLSDELDAALTQAESRQQRPAAEIIRDALAAYLRAS